MQLPFTFLVRPNVPFGTRGRPLQPPRPTFIPPSHLSSVRRNNQLILFSLFLCIFHVTQRSFQTADVMARGKEDMFIFSCILSQDTNHSPDILHHFLLKKFVRKRALKNTENEQKMKHHKKRQPNEANHKAMSVLQFINS